MILGRDIANFFDILDVIANPERAKQVMQEMQDRLDMIEAREQDVSKREESVKGAKSAADNVLATQKQKEEEYQKKAAEIAGDKQKLVKEKDAFEHEKSAHAKNVTAVQELAKNLAERAKGIENVEFRLGDKAAKFAIERAKLKKEQEEHEAKVARLKAIV